MEEFINGIVNRLSEEFNPEMLGESAVIIMANLIVGLLTFTAFYLLWFILDRMLKFFMRHTKVDQTTSSFIITTVKYVLITIGAVQALSAIGINTPALVTSLGIAGLTIGFAARDALSNLISGILIFWDRPFVIGDLVDVGGNYGRVDRITLRSTRIITIDGRMLAVPNTTIVNSTVASYTNFPNLRLDVDVTVAVTEDIDRVRERMLNLVRKDPRYLQVPTPEVVVNKLSDYNVTLQLQVWLDNERDHIPRRFELREKIFNELRSAGIEMPFETIRVISG